MISTSELKTELEFYKSMYKEYNSQLEKLPEGNICFKKEHGRQRAYIYKDGNCKYLSQDKSELIGKLIKRKCICESIQYIENNIKVLKDAIFKFTDFNDLWPSTIREQFNTNIDKPYSEIKTDFSLQAMKRSYGKSVDEWMAIPRNSNPYKPENKKHTTPGGTKVRSKSELIIASYLESMRIPYKYEEQLIINNEIVYPDFMIKRVRDGKIIIWEYFGMMDDEEYRSRAEHKIFIYGKNGYLPYENFIATYGDNNSSVSMIQLEQITKIMLI